MSFQSLFGSHKTDGKWQLGRGGSLLWKCGDEPRPALVFLWVQSRNLYQVLRRFLAVLAGPRRHCRDNKEQKCSLESQRREERVASDFGKTNWGRAWALLHFLLTALWCVGTENNMFWRASEARRAREQADSYVGDVEHVCAPSPGPGCAQPLLSTSLWAAAQLQCMLLHLPFPGISGKHSSATWLAYFLFWVMLQILSVNMDSCMHACFPAHEKMTGQELNLLVLFQNFHGLMGVVFADTVSTPVPHGWLGRNLSWAHREQCGEGSPPQWACHSPCCRADGSRVSSQLEVCHGHGSIPKYKEF